MHNVINATPENRFLLFRDAGSKLNIPTPMIEKDFWVCFVLSKIFSDPELRSALRFKGGTSLSKGYGVIERFSEDLDLILDKTLVLDDEPLFKETYKKQKLFADEVDAKVALYISTVLKDKIEKLLGDVVQIYTDEEYTHVNPKYTPKVIDNKLLHVVYKHTSEERYLRSDILLEIGVMSARTPYEDRDILPYVATAFDSLDIKPISVPTVMPKRTFWDKATILHREHYRPATKKKKETGAELPNYTPTRYSRHYYDLYKMGHTSIKDEALADRELLKDVVERKDKLYHCQWAKYEDCLNGQFRLLPNDQNKIHVSQDYKAMRNMIYGDAPEWEDIFAYLAELEKEINNL